MFRKKRRAVVEGPVRILAVELVGTVRWMAWERWPEKERARAEATKEQDATESAESAAGPGENAEEAAAEGSRSSRGGCSLGDSE